VGQAILPAAAFQAAFSHSLNERRLKAGGSQDWLPHLGLGSKLFGAQGVHWIDA